MTVQVEVQRASEDPGIPGDDDFRRWVAAALAGHREAGDIVIRVVDADESQTLNREFRHRDKPTNVLSFPFEAPSGVPPEEAGEYLGDLVICAPVVRAEAAEQGKPLAVHWAHMVVHGALHLLGFDHLDDEQARQMEGLERTILARLGVPDPYQNEETS